MPINYEQYQLKTYNYWTTYLHYNQAYLGRCYIALNRSGNLDPYADTTAKEKTELETAIAQLQHVLTALYQPDLFNYANFRNTWPRCHWHVIPRYQTQRTVHGHLFSDDNWGRNYAPYNREFQISADAFTQILKNITAGLSRMAP